MDREAIVKGIQECDLNGGLIGNCPYKGILTLLKEQEAVVPTWSRGKPFCGACGLRIHGGKFCSECGKQITWEGR